MLQQTQVATVWPYYTRWMKLFPTVEALAKADLDQVLKIWEGLGYYSRARNLHKAAHYVVQNYNGTLPDSVESLLKIPGIGPYTAAAVASLAFGHPVPLIDGNVLRVLTRVGRVKDDISKAKTKAIISSQLKPLIPEYDPGSFNQGLMDLGRVICSPRHPKCEDCPIQPACQAYRLGDMEQFPVKKKRPDSPHYEIVIGLIRRKDKVLIQKRPEEGLLGGLWEFPGGKIEAGEEGELALLREIKEETGLDVDICEKIGTIQHAYTHFKITLSAWFCDWKKGEPQTLAATKNRWINMHQIQEYAFPKANLKILELLKQ